MIVSVQGNIGCGKSTLVNKMRNQVGVSDQSWKFVEEPVKEWEKFQDSAGNSILSLFYEKPKEHAFAFQMMAYISRLEALKKQLWSLPQVLVSERSLEADKEVFESMLHASGDISQIEHAIYNKWFEHFAADCLSDKVVYLKCSPATAYKRIRKRNRTGENISLQYLEKCHRAHERWLNSVDKDKILIIDANEDLDADPKLHDRWIQQICDFIRE